jgi:hypothetical protein
MKLIDYIFYRVFQYFEKKNPSMSKSNSVSFMALFEGSLIVPIFMIFNGIFHFYSSPENPNLRMKYYIGIPLAIILIIGNTIYFKRKLTKTGIEKLRTRFESKEKLIPIWIIFILPIIFVFVLPIIYGWINGSLRFIH